jgi:hypothetical protein
MEVGLAGIDAPGRGGPYRAALAAVIILSVLMLLGVVALVAGFVRQYRLYQQDHAPVAAAASLQLAPGTRILSAAVQGNRLLLHVQTPAGGALEVIDLDSGKLAAEVKETGP